MLFNWRVITHGGPVTLVWDSTHMLLVTACVRVCLCVFGAWLSVKLFFFLSLFFLAFLPPLQNGCRL